MKAARVGHFIKIGGTGSLELPGEPYKTAADSREFWLAYRRSIADSEAATKHMEDRIGPGPMSESMRAYRNARISLHKGEATEADHQVMKAVDEQILLRDNPVPDLPIAARATFMMFDGNDSFKWSFVSPPGRFRPGPRTGKYDVYIDEVPLTKDAKTWSVDVNPFEGRLLGVSAADLAVAIVDEAEKKEKVGKHWSAVSEWPSDEPMPTILTI